MCTCELQSCLVVQGASLMLGHHGVIPTNGDAVAPAQRKVLVKNDKKHTRQGFRKMSI